MPKGKQNSRLSPECQSSHLFNGIICSVCSGMNVTKKRTHTLTDSTLERLSTQVPIVFLRNTYKLVLF